MSEDLRKAALEYHQLPTPGKIAVLPTKGMLTQRDLALAYSPGVAEACHAIVAEPAQARALTARANLVAVVTNGSAVLGLGNIGPLAAKPVMEGKACLFKKFAGIDVFDVEIDEHDPDRLVEIIASLEPTFGGINLEDIKSPECFYVESRLRERMRIPVFHDDQHGTAIVAGAALLNALRLVGKELSGVRLVCSGAGAAALACLDLLVELGLRPEHVHVADIDGLVYAGRTKGMDARKARYARETDARTLAEVIGGADVFLGLSAGGVLTGDMVARMAPHPVILALANPVPEIMPEVVRAVRPDAIIGTGRSDYPNQVNNVLCFPFIFRGALDVGATTINEAMKLACVRALADLAMEEVPDAVASAYGGGGTLRFGPEYLIPKPFDPRLIERIAPAVARAAMESGVATRAIEDFDAYRERLTRFVYRSGTAMQPVFSQAKGAPPKRVVYADGEDERVLRAAQIVSAERLARPLLLGRPAVIAERVAALGLRLRPGTDCEVVDPEHNPGYDDLWREYYALTARRGTTQQDAQLEMRTRPTAIGAMLVARGDADAMLCGTYGDYRMHLRDVAKIIGMRPGVTGYAAMNMLMLPERTLFICDTYVNLEPSAERIAEMTLLAAEEVRRFGLVPRVALLSHSSFGSSDDPPAQRMREALALIERMAPDLCVEGEMQGDAALSRSIQTSAFPGSRLDGEANLLIMPNLDAANISFSLLKAAAGGNVTVGPILLGAARPVHILTPTATVRRIVNMTALAALAAGARGAPAERVAAAVST
jgi:malate dehydrogenase (oxaloacetate-decarboxylating)(NADP+)